MVRPLNRFGIDKRGTCGLCGRVGALSKTHVPPRCAGNDGGFSPLVVDDSSRTLAEGRRRLGGCRAYLLCRNCNNRLGTYDADFGTLWRSLAAQLRDAAGQTSSDPIVIVLEQARPGAIIRSILGCFFAINPHLRERFPEVAESVLTGCSTQPPPDASLLCNLYLGDRGYVSGGATRLDRHSGQTSSVDGEIAWAPLHLVLADETARQEWPSAMPILPWLEDSDNGIREVAIMVPAIGDDDLFTRFGSL